jgi:hypothetical protein
MAANNDEVNLFAQELMERLQADPDRVGKWVKKHGGGLLIHALESGLLDPHIITLLIDILALNFNRDTASPGGVMKNQFPPASA